MTFIVDSDDVLTDDAVETILAIYEQYKDNEELCGYVFLRAFPDGKINGKRFPEEMMLASYIDVRINSNDTKADKAEVFLTRCLREEPFPEYMGEKFLGEDIVWIRMGRRYKMLHINKVIYIGNYMPDGLTKNRRRNNISSPVGCMNRALEFMKKDIRLKYRIKGGLQYIIYGRIAGYSLLSLYNKSCYKSLFILSMSPALLLYYKWKHIY